jgi:fructokinase
VTTTFRRHDVVTDTLDSVYRQEGLPSHVAGARVLLIGEVLWDEFPDGARLGGAPLNAAVHLRRLRHAPLLVSAVGADLRGNETRSALTALGLDTTFVPTAARFHTGSARVQLGPGDETSFTIERPAAYDAVELSEKSLQRIVAWNPTWLYYGTLFPSFPQPRRVLSHLLDGLPEAARFYDLNLRPGFESPELVDDLLRRADVAKLNEQELQFVQGRLNLPPDPEGFCRAGAERYGWRGACVTLGARGCAMLVGDDYVEAPGFQVHVADPVGAGDAFAAAFIHGIVSSWPAERIATVANRMGALVAASQGAIPAAGCP